MKFYAFFFGLTIVSLEWLNPLTSVCTSILCGPSFYFNRNNLVTVSLVHLFVPLIPFMLHIFYQRRIFVRKFCDQHEIVFRKKLEQLHFILSTNDLKRLPNGINSHTQNACFKLIRKNRFAFIQF